MVFPSDNQWVSQGGAATDVAPNTISDMKILFMEKPKAFMHKAKPTETPAIRTGLGSGGTVWGKVTWDYESPSGGVQWGIVATPSSKAKGVKIKASYLSDYAMKEIYSPETARMLSLSSPEDIRGSKWSYALETQLQKWIQEQVKKNPDKWIAETVTTRSEGTNAEGDYKLQFNGTWGPARNKGVYNYTPPALWPQDKKDRIGTVAASPNDGSFAVGIGQDTKHINIDWMFISADDTEDLRLMTPFNNNWFTGTSGLTGNWGIHSGWAQGAFGVTTAVDTNNNIRADFGFGSPGVNFEITNYDSEAKTAMPGDIAQTKTTGLPYKLSSDNFVIVWYDPDGNEVGRGKPQKPSSTGTIDSAPLDTSKLKIDKTTEYTAKLYRVKPGGNLEDQPIAADSFTVEVSHLFISRYDDVSIANPKAGDKEMKGATYSATGLPEDLQIDSNNGTISGKAKKAGLYKANFKTVLTDPSGQIEGTRARYIAVTDSPLAAGEVGVAYSQAVKPEPAKDPKGKDYIYKIKSVNFISGKEVAGLSVTGDATNGFKITGTPTAKAEATEDVLSGDPGPNVEVTYDIYKTNDSGKEVLIKANHLDKVPLVVKDGESAKYEPKYTEVDGKVGEVATVLAPKFLDQKSTTEPKPEANPQPTGMTFALGKDAPTGAKVDKDTGVVTYTPVAGDEGKPVNVTVVVTYSDGTTDNATATINVAKKDSDLYTPSYADKDGKAGEAVTTEAPTFKDGDGKNAKAPEGTKYTLGKDAPEGATIDEKTGKVTYTPKESEAGKSVEIPVVVTYPDKSTDNATAKIKVAKLDDVIDRTDDPTKPTPDGYVRVTFKNGEGVNEIANNKVYDVKEGTALTADKYPEVTVKGGYENPVWSTPAGTAITADNATITATAKATTPGKDTTKPTIGDLDDDDDHTTPVAPKEDTTNKGPQVWANGARVVEGQKIKPITVNVTDDTDKNPTVEVTGLPKGLSYNKETGKIEGTPEKLTNWADTEEEKDFTATIKAKDTAGNEATKDIQITVLRDTDGDGIPDTTDPDDDNDGINDDQDQTPKKWDAKVEGKVTTPKGTQPTADQYKEKIKNLPEGSKVEVKTQPDVSKAGDTTAVVTVTLPNGEEVDVTVPVTVTDTTPGPTQQTATPVIKAPKAGDKTITGTSEPNAKVVVELPDVTKIETTADGEGKWTANVPEGKEPKENDVIKAVATVDGKTPSEEATATVGKVETPDDKPVIDDITEGDENITGKGEPGAKIVVKDKDGNTIGETTVGGDGKWVVPVPADKPLKAGDKITAIQTNGGKTSSAETIVKGKTTPTPEPQPTPDYNPWWPIWFGSTMTEVKKEEPKHLERHEAYIAGYPDGTVRPDGKITRAEVSAIFARLTENSSLANYSPKFSDVLAYDWFCDSVMKLSNKDIIKGYPDGTFKPNKSITRAEFAVIASKYIKNPKAADEVFADVPMNHWAKDAIAKVKAEGWISGYNDGTFRPDAPITRAEAVSIVNRMFGRSADGEFVREHGFEIKSFKDLVENHWAYYDMIEAVHTHDYERIGTRVERWEKIVK